MANSNNDGTKNNILAKLFTKNNVEKKEPTELKEIITAVKRGVGRPKGTSKYHDIYRNPKTGKMDYNAIYIDKANEKKKLIEKSPEEKLMDKKLAIERGQRLAHFCCPICHRIEPLFVRINPKNNTPLKKDIPGVEYVEVGGQLQKRFIGPVEGYYPIKIFYRRKGLFENEEENMTAGELYETDKEYFLSIFNALTSAMNYFQRVMIKKDSPLGDNNISPY